MLLHERWDMQRHMKRNALVSLADAIWADDVTVVVRKISIRVNAASPKGAVFTEWHSCHNWCVDRLFPLQTNKCAAWKLTQAVVILLETTSGGRGNFVSSSSRQRQPGSNVSQIKWSRLKEIREHSQLLWLAGGAWVVSCRRQAVKSSRVGGNRWYF